MFQLLTTFFFLYNDEGSLGLGRTCATFGLLSNIKVRLDVASTSQ
jgi:hypothetical protein